MVESPVNGAFEVELVDAATGKKTIYRRWEDLPAEWRAKIAPMLGGADGNVPASIAPVTFRDASGDQVGFSSVSEMPEDVRRLYGGAPEASHPISGQKLVIWKTRQPRRLGFIEGSPNRARDRFWIFAVVATLVAAAAIWWRWRRLH
jgi:hypothetical protein